MNYKYTSYLLGALALNLSVVATAADSKRKNQSQKKADDTPIAKASQLTSLQGRLRASETLSVDTSELLNTAPMAHGNFSKAQVEKAQGAVEETRRQMRTLAIGNFRSENLSGGDVSAPGVADFGNFFRSGPRLGTKSKDEMSRQAEAEALRVQTIESIQQILKTKPVPEQKFVLFMRLAELEVERHAYYLELEIKNFNEAHSKWQQTRKGAEPVFKTDRSAVHLLAATDALRSLATQFPNHQRAPEVLFNLGFLLTQAQNESAVLYFDRLVKRFPKSDYIPDTYLALGEFYFSRNQFDKALSNYQRVLNYKNTRAYNYSVYKLGWTYFNLRDKTENDTQKNLSKSLSAFKLVVKLAENTQDTVLKDLRREALKDMVLVYTDLGDIDGAQRYYEGLGEPELYVTLLERLAWHNSEHGRYDKAVAIYERLISENQTHARLPEFYAKVPEFLEKQGKRAKLLNALTVMSAALAPDGRWMQAHKSTAGAAENREKVLSKELLKWAQRFHFEAQKQKREKSYDDALAAYNLYIDNFGEKPEAYTAHFYRAEILVQKSRYVEATDGYLKAVAIDEKYNLKGKFTRDALSNSIQAMDIALSKTQPVKLPEMGKATQKIPLTALHARLLKALDGYVKLYPNDERSLGLAHRAASIVYAYGDYHDADVRWTALARRYPRSEEVYTGARLILKVSVDKQDWQTAIVESRKFLEIKGVRESKLGKDLVTVLKGSVFQRALALEREEKRDESAEMFLSYHREFQDDADAPKALFNAANNKFRVGKVDEALSALRTILAQYPHSALAPNSLYLIASSYDALGEFSNSASNYEQLAKDVPTSPVIPEALLRAAEQRSAIGDHALAVKDASLLIEKYESSPKATEAWLVLGKTYTKMNNHNMAAKTYLNGAEAVGSKRASYSLLLYGLAAEALLRNNETTAAQNVCTTARSVLAKIPDGSKDANAQEGLRLVGLTELALLDTKLAGIYKQSISNPAQLTAQFTKIRDDVQKLAQKYVAVVKLGNAEAGVGALYRIAEMQEYLGNVLLKAPAPSGAKPDELETYRSTLERIALPLQEEATNLYATAWQKANETEAITPYTRRIYDKLVALRPGEFRPLVEDLPAPSYFSSEIAVAPETKKLVKE